MRVLIHDYAGHPFQVQLSRQLAMREHDVLHAYCGSLQTPQGTMQRRPDDPVGLEFECIDLGKQISKTNFLQRFLLESQYGKRLVEVCKRFRPDVIISGNTPSIPQVALTRHCAREEVRHVFWVQDIYGLAAYRMLKKRIPLVGHLIGKYFMRLDRFSAQLSDSLVVISDDFIPFFEKWGIDRRRIEVIHNWSNRDELPVRPRENPWGEQQGLSSGPRFIYTGTLSMKHNPELLLALAKMLDERGSGELVVVSEGNGIDWLRQKAPEHNVRSLKFAGFQPFEVMADVLGSADVLVVLLESDAGAFCVPSKVLSYFCAGRAVLGAMPAENLSARIIVEHGAGKVVAPDDVQGFCQAATEFIESATIREACGQAARRYADEHFDIEKITDRFEKILTPVSPI